MPSSRLTPDGRCVVTTPGAGLEVGHTFTVRGSGATWGIDYSDWLLRLVGPGSVNLSDRVFVRPAEEALLEQLRSRELHPALVEEPQAA
jgi:hypothetical protein